MSVKIFMIGNAPIIAELSSSNELTKSHFLKNPATILVTPQKDASGNIQFGIGMIPAYIFAKNNLVEVMWDSIQMICDPDEQVLNIYSQQFGSGLVIAKPSDVPKHPSQLWTSET